MLGTVLRYLKNWFLIPDGIKPGIYEIKNGGVTLPFLADGQYFRIVGSIFNDGLHQYPATDLKDEKFEGAIWVLAVPDEVVDLSERIKEWKDKNEPTVYTSENFFGQYSYTKATGTNGVPADWDSVFANELKLWRKI